MTMSEQSSAIEGYCTHWGQATLHPRHEALYRSNKSAEITLKRSTYAPVFKAPLKLIRDGHLSPESARLWARYDQNCQQRRRPEWYRKVAERKRRATLRKAAAKLEAQLKEKQSELDKAVSEMKTISSKLGSRLKRFLTLRQTVDKLKREQKTLSPRSYQLMGNVTGWDGKKVFFFGAAINDDQNAPGMMLQGAGVLVNPAKGEVIVNSNVHAQGVYFVGRSQGRNAFGGPVTVFIYSHTLPKKVARAVKRMERRVKKAEKKKARASRSVKEYLSQENLVRQLETDIKRLKLDLMGTKRRGRGRARGGVFGR